MLAWLVMLACVLPVAIAIILLVARLLASLNDASGASVLDRVALGGGIAWAVDGAETGRAQRVRKRKSLPR